MHDAHTYMYMLFKHKLGLSEIQIKHGYGLNSQVLFTLHIIVEKFMGYFLDFPEMHIFNTQ